MSSPWEGYEAGLRLRGYQERALERFHATVEAGQRSFYLVAPPGAGKTLLGLLIASALERPAVCLSPNAAIQEQWLARLREHWLCLDSTREAFQPHPLCGGAPRATVAALVSLTYQKIAVGDRDEDRLHDNVIELHQALRQHDVGTVILDECHHLSGEWGRACEALCRALDRPFVVGLTATPVERADGPLVRLLGQPDHVISLPSVIRTGDLSPFQDLCHIIAPAPEEQSDLEGSLGRFERLMAGLRRSDQERFSLDSWCDMLELEPRDPAGEPYADLLDFLRAEPDLVTAWCRLRVEAGHEPPAVLPYLPELYEPPTLADRLELAAAYTARYLLVEHPDAPLTGQAAEVLDDWGLKVRAGVVTRRVGRVSRALGFSRQKLQATLEILRTELRHLGPDLRALIITDFEFPPAARRALSCVDVMELLTSVADVDEVDPILITGKSLLVDDDLWSRFAAECGGFCEERGIELEIERTAEAGYWRLSGSGPAWSTRIQVALVTRMLERGISRCLIGTRSLLGEGWDCLRLNTLIDLTVVTSGVAVNQIRGRTIRRDPDNPAKVANNWDVLCLSAVGEGTELERLRSRHARLYGVTDDGLIERGTGHIHACFSRVSPAELFQEREAVNDMMHRRAADRGGARERWQVGRPFRDRDFPVLSFRPRAPRAATPGSSAAAPAVPARRGAELLMVPRAQRRARRELGLVLGAGTAAAAGLALGLAPVAAPLALLALVPLALTPLGLRALGRRRFGEADLAQELLSLAEVLLAAADQPGEAAITRRDDGTLRVVWHAVEPGSCEQLSSALAELLGPLTPRRYLLAETLSAVPPSAWARLWRRGQPVTRVFTVPRMLARKSRANALLAAWRELRNPAVELHHVQSEAGAELVRGHLHTRPFAGEAAIRAVWS